MRTYKSNRFTKRHLEQIAEVLRSVRPFGSAGNYLNNGAYTNQWTTDRNALIEVFRADNPRFDIDRFIKWTER